MNEFKRKQWTRIGLSLIALIIAVLFLTGVIGSKPMTYQVKEPLTPMMEGITVTMGQNAENSAAEDYLKQDPYLVNIYEGYGFAKDYKAARGHSFTLEDVSKTERPHAKAQCITCKTPDFTKMVNKEGVEVYTRPFDEVMEQMTQAISCYSCHGDDKGNNGQIVITHSYVEKALGENASAIDPKVLNCGQCHIEYYFTPEDGETMMPYSSREEMTPEAILAYYDEMGFKDWEQPGTGTPMLKAQHPEMETFLYSAHANMGLNCASCHMAEETAEDGSTYHSHYLVSPLQSETLMATCAACHGSADAARTLVTSTQEKVTARETETGNRLSGLKDALTAAVSEGNLTEEELDALRKLHREAQWFFDFCYVENSEGAHNSKLSLRCLDTADEKIAEAMALLTGEAPESTEPEPEAEGVLTAAEQGFGGAVTVKLTLNEDGTVQTLAVETPDETVGLGQRASEAAFTDQFVGKAGPFTYGENGIDALSGATVTSNAVLKAVNGLLGGAEPAAEEKPAEEPSEEEKPAEEPAKTEDKAEQGGTVYGSYLAEKETNFSVIRVFAGTKDGKITDCRITSEGENDYLTEEIRTAWAKAIVENQTADTDAITGATLQYSAGAVQEAVAEILRQIGGAEPAAEEPAAEEKPAEEPAKTEEKAEQGGTVYGSYLAEKETDFSVIRVFAGTKDGKITDCRITSEGENDYLTEEIRTAWAKAIVENQTADTDAITGATLKYSAGAVQEAVADILRQISGETAMAEQPAPEEPAAEEKPAEESAKAEEKAEQGGTVYGGYLARRETPFSVIRVIAAAKDGKITDCKILCEAKEGQTDLVTDENEAAWATAVVANQSAEIDAVAGATISTDAVKEAVAEILEKIGGEPAAEEKSAEEPAKAEEKAEQGGTVYGGYLARRETPFSVIRVIAAAKDGKITDCKILCEAKEGQTDLVTDENETAWAKAVVANQSAEIDAVARATISTDAVKEAVVEILEKVGK